MLTALKVFDVAESHCYDPNEEVKLRTVINAVGRKLVSHDIRVRACWVPPLRAKSRLLSSIRTRDYTGASLDSQNPTRSGVQHSLRLLCNPHTMKLTASPM